MEVNDDVDKAASVEATRATYTSFANQVKNGQDIIDRILKAAE